SLFRTAHLSLPTRRSSDLTVLDIPADIAVGNAGVTIENVDGITTADGVITLTTMARTAANNPMVLTLSPTVTNGVINWVMTGNRSEEHTSELQSRENFVCR